MSAYSKWERRILVSGFLSEDHRVTDHGNRETAIPRAMATKEL